MDLYILDGNGQRIDIVEQYESLIWTDRMKSAGDFELLLPADHAKRDALEIELRLYCTGSYTPMRIESHEDIVEEGGKRLLRVKGRSQVMDLTQRVAASTSNNPKWNVNGTPTHLARRIYTEICVDGKLNPKDVLTYMQLRDHTQDSDLFPKDTVPAGVDSVNKQLELQSVYSAIKLLATEYDFGFRVSYDPKNPLPLWFDVYTGVDRTGAQTKFPPVIFSPTLENLSNTHEYTSIVDLKNVAYVISSLGHKIEVTAPGYNPNTSGFRRRVLPLYVEVEETWTEEYILGYMQNRGYEELAKHRVYSAFDGEVSQTSRYRYLQDYNVGDLVEMQNTTGDTNIMRVTENIIVADVEGYRSYPTLELREYAQSGTWRGWDPLREWAQMGPEQWADMP